MVRNYVCAVLLATSFTAFAANAPVAKESNQKPSSNCAPKDAYQCKSSCRNTSCTVEFNNGCKMAVVVRQRQEMKFGMNPANGKMENHFQWVNEDPCKAAAGF
jgi:hypothetical protein